MDQVIWVEILSRHRDVTARFRFAGPEVRVGRGYDNDVVIDDPYVAARHVRVFRDETGRLVAEDLDSANGMFLDHDKGRRARIVIDGERPIRIGHSYLRIREASHSVPRERAGRTGARIFPIALAAALGVAILGLELLASWVSDIGEPRASHYLAPLLTVAVAVAAWATVWMVLTRIFSGRARFERNLLIALFGLLALSLYNEFVQFSAFALTWRIPTSYAYAATWCILAVVCFFHLREIGPSRLELKGALVVTLAALAIAIQTLTQSEALSDIGQQSTVRRLLPPALRIVPVRNEDAFFAEIEQLKAKLDRDRAQARGDDAR